MAGKEKIESIESLTFDDVLLVPSKSEVLPADVNTLTKLTKNIKINIPIISASMDTVTESDLAIAIAREGGVGIIHKNMPVAKQGEEVKRVKKSESWMVKEPLTVSPNHTLDYVKKISKEFDISSFPVMQKGKLIGMLSKRDVRFEEDSKRKVSDLMTKDVITGSEDITMEKATELMSRHKIEKIPIVDKKGNLKGLITLTDLDKHRKYPHASKDSEGHLLVGASIGPFDDKRLETLIDKGVDVILIDVAHGHSKNVINYLKSIKKRNDIDVIAGNVATAEGAEDLISAGADAVKVGIGAGSICTSRIIAGVGVPQLSAIMHCAEAAGSHGVPLISDGGTRYSGDIAKAIAAGAHVVMLGSLLAGTEESPGRHVFIQGRKYKTYRGMGSVSAMKLGSAERYFQDGSKKLVPEGIEGIVPYRGTVREIVYQLIGGVKSSMGYCGCKNIEDMIKNTKLRKITKAGVVESHPHDVLITEEAPNYWKLIQP
ncbi:MAG: IMP dehydrogenase [Candidatus Aenigmatarchaeota archaeon]|nr:MAG: IMP dehydrogenase [Candidatus Aenigmarchaeota archaeon]